jgi:hypothetical protein
MQGDEEYLNEHEPLTPDQMESKTTDCMAVISGALADFDCWLAIFAHYGDATSRKLSKAHARRVCAFTRSTVRQFWQRFQR